MTFYHCRRERHEHESTVLINVPPCLSSQQGMMVAQRNIIGSRVFGDVNFANKFILSGTWGFESTAEIFVPL